MVFELTDSLIDEQVIDNKTISDSLHNLFLGFEEGNLILSLSPALLDFLETRLKDPLSRRVVNHLQHHLFVHYDVLWQIKVVLDNPDLTKHELAIDFFKNTSAIQPPTLLCENLNDTRFYFALCREYFGVDFINTKNGLGGGGSSTADALEKIVNDNDRFCLCIVDSDIKYPGCSDGGTYVAIQNKGLPESPVYEVYKLKVHEIENLIPIDFVYKHIKKKQISKFSYKLKRIDQDGDILRYYDVKKGIRLSTIQSEKDYYCFAETIYRRLCGSSDHTSFEAYISRVSNDMVFSHLCPGILDVFLNQSLSGNSRFIYCDYLREDWEEIQKYIVTFFCARRDEPIN